MTRPIPRDVVHHLTPLAPDMLREAMGGDATAARHDALAARMPALRQIETARPAGPAGPLPAKVRVAAWNLERGKAV